MIDPLTALSIATTAVGQIKELLQAGRDASGALSKFAGAYSDIAHAERKANEGPKWYSILGSDEQIAIDAFVAKKKADQMKQEIETLIGYTYGKTGLDEYKATLRRVKKQREQHEYRKAEIKDKIIEVSLILLILSLGLTAFAVIIYFIGKNEGKW
jgi:hypothetical protein